MALFSIGDTVRLNSGGPLMTVIALPNEFKGMDHFECVWFDDEKHLHRGCLIGESMHRAKVQSTGL